MEHLLCAGISSARYAQPAPKPLPDEVTEEVLALL